MRRRQRRSESSLLPLNCFNRAWAALAQVLEAVAENQRRELAAVS
jgi:hypothetical protein